MKNNNYSIVVNYNKNGKDFKSVIEEHIKSILKIPTKYWNFYNNDIKYK